MASRESERPLRLRFVASFARARDLPGTEAEIALVGRSNVGKSSLINAAANQRNLARTSKTPGATRLLNAFELGPEGSGRWLVDLPGYGYARASKADRRAWAAMVEGYLIDRRPLRGVLHLIDGAIGPTASDLETQAWLAEIGLPVSYAATKADKVKPSATARRRNELADKLGTAPGDVSWTSARTGAGIADLRSRIQALLGA